MNPNDITSIRDIYDAAMVNAGLSDWEIAQVNRQFELLVSNELTKMGELIEMSDYR